VAPGTWAGRRASRASPATPWGRGALGGREGGRIGGQRGARGGGTVSVSRRVL
jgi:hypothetical protein